MHCLHAYIFKAGTFDVSDVPHAEHEGFVILVMSDKLFTKLGSPKLLDQTLRETIKTYAEIQTDYFGGGGEQEAKLFIDGREEYVPEPDHPIDWALEKLGVVKKDGMDEFDTISLGSYRDAASILDEWTEKFKQSNPKQKSGLEIERRYLLKAMPYSIRDRILAGLRGKKIGQVYVEYENGERVRLRRVFDPTSNSYTYYETKKKTISFGVNQEDEREITEGEYTEGLKHAKKQISKTRYEYECGDVTWEIDDFGSMVIAEVELPHIDHFAPMPDDLEAVLVMEITGMDQFTNYNLASQT